MSHDLKRRLIGATVLISLAIIFLPMILEHEPLMVDRGDMQPIPKAVDEKFKSSLIRDEVPEEQPRPVASQSSPSTPAPATEKPVPKSASPKTAEAASPAKPEPVKQEPKPETKPASQEIVEAASTAKPEPVKQEPKPAPKPAPTKPGPSAWVIQVGSFSNQDNALKLVQRLREAGLDTMDPQPAVVNGKQLYRVKVGPELDKRNAEKLLPKVKKVAGLQGTVIRYP